MVCTNTTVYKETDMAEIEELFEYLKQFNVDGHQIAPAYGYSAVNDREIFLTRDDIHEKFRDIDRLAKKYAVRQTPMYLEFLKGERELPCTAWGNPTYNIKGWKGPCYLITDGHYKTFEDLMTQTPWESYGPGNDPRCEHCMMHCGFEPSAALGINARIGRQLQNAGMDACASGVGGGRSFCVACQPAGRPQTTMVCPAEGRMKPVLVTGASGFLGWHVARAAGGARLSGARAVRLVRPAVPAGLRAG